MIQNAVGGAQGNIGKSTVLDFQISFPSNSSEQTSIAEISKDLQLEIEMIMKRLEKLKLQKQGMMQNLLTGKIRLV
jgi:type I restriction enzyme S subunit